MWATHEAIVGFTHKVRYSAQARALEARGLKFNVRDDGTIALRQEELDAYTLTNAAKSVKAKREWRPDLSVVRNLG